MDNPLVNFEFRLLLLRLSTGALVSMLVKESDDLQAEIIRQELLARHNG